MTGAMTRATTLLTLTALVMLTTATLAGAQTRKTTVQRRPASPAFTVRGFADVGMETFQATRSFQTIFGKANGMVFGGGVEIVARRGAFADVRVSRFRTTGERAFVYNGTVFHVGVSDTVTITPLEFTGGYRLMRRGWRVVPYFGGGIGLHRYAETSQFSSSADDVSQTFMGYHVAGGAEVPVSRWVKAAGEMQWGTVPNALGQNADGVSSAFHETNLGGATVRVKVVIGR